MGCQLIFVDTETLGFDPELAIWELAFVTAAHTNADELVLTSRWQRFLALAGGELAAAEEGALRVTRFYDRYPMTTLDLRGQGDRQELVDAGELAEPWDAADALAIASANRHWVGAVPSFDTIRADNLLRTYGRAPAWHYHLIDVENLVAAHLKIAPPWRSVDLLDALDIKLDPALRHTAGGDVDACVQAYAAVYDLTIIDNTPQGA